MKRTAGKKYKEYIVLNKEEITHIKDLVQRYCECIEFESETVDGSKIEFESFEELLSYSNFGEDKIKSLNIHGSNPYNSSLKNKINIDFGSRYYSDECYVSCSYSFESKDDEIVFQQSFDSILKRCNENQKTYILGRLLFLILCFLLEFRVIISLLVASYHEKVLGVGIFCSILLLGLAVGLSALFNLIWKKTFLPIVFAWGAELKHEEKMSHIRSNIIWGIIVASIVSVILSFVI